MRKIILSVLLTLFMAATATAQGGLVSVRSNHSVQATADRLELALKEKGITIFARIDHAQVAREIGQNLPPTQLVIFGSASIGAVLIERSRSMGIDLPLKALIWKDPAGQVWFTYPAPDELARRHGIVEMDEAIGNLQVMLSDLVSMVTMP
ncbi:hypothetical protein DSCO28_68950 [Desulfosarcina ovata subsp. sediminis]|uniref:DUF302 domain-containing protein n=1 Tax=Desulfosarcina ovata subsp. sediminis TaxID=885957 RepID=A0A5K8A188_9BACT|nr:DUF302 domain-containing protein [Desulfosarcina ovata]BBO86329.1 hypothetical protein DSCO28_68950 [Desulfosarcina ovata subsp. sediminis]